MAVPESEEGTTEHSREGHERHGERMPAPCGLPVRSNMGAPGLCHSVWPARSSCGQFLRVLYAGRSTHECALRASDRAISSAHLSAGALPAGWLRVGARRSTIAGSSLWGQNTEHGPGMPSAVANASRKRRGRRSEARDEQRVSRSQPPSQMGDTMVRAVAHAVASPSVRPVRQPAFQCVNVATRATLLSAWCSVP